MPLATTALAALLTSACGGPRPAAQAASTLLLGTGSVIVVASAVELAGPDEEDFVDETGLFTTTLLVGGALALGGAFGLVQSVRSPSSPSSPAR